MIEIEDDSHYYKPMSKNGGCYSILRKIFYFTDRINFYKLELTENSSEFYTDDFGHFCNQNEIKTINLNDIDINLKIRVQIYFSSNGIKEESIEKYLKKTSSNEVLYCSDMYISSCYDNNGVCNKKSEFISEPLSQDIIEIRLEKLKKLGVNI